MVPRCQGQCQLRRLADKKSYCIGRRLCKDIAGEILDNMERYMLSNMRQDIILETVIPKALDRVTEREISQLRS